MRTRLFLLPLLVLPVLAACSAPQDNVISAYTSDDPAPALDGTCRSVADTGDMYRYCLEYGPQQALAPSIR